MTSSHLSHLSLRNPIVLLHVAGVIAMSCATDITCSWPVSGKFTEQQKIVYNAVLAAHSGVIAAMAPGVLWPKLHTLAYE
jgi:Xaa-Pro aminopeptidase